MIIKFNTYLVNSEMGRASYMYLLTKFWNRTSQQGAAENILFFKILKKIKNSKIVLRKNDGHVTIHNIKGFSVGWLF